jgi:hypothetical protein
VPKEAKEVFCEKKPKKHCRRAKKGFFKGEIWEGVKKCFLGEKRGDSAGKGVKTVFFTPIFLALFQKIPRKMAFFGFLSSVPEATCYW